MDKQLDYLLTCLLHEDSRFCNASVPDSPADKWQLFRSLVNVRRPKPIGKEFLTVQDEFLQTLIADKGITDVDTLKPMRDKLCLWRGDITTLKAGAIVNAANRDMLGCFAPCHGCIDNAIHTYAGVQLRMECSAIMEKQGVPEPTGQAKITPAYNLPSQSILHTVGPIVGNEVFYEDRQLLANCYRSCMALAQQNKIESIAFCCISTGEFHFPNEEAAQIAIDTVSSCLKKDSSIKKVVFNVFTEQDEEIYKRLLG